MNITNRVKILEQQTKRITLADTPKFYENAEAYEKALKDNKVKKHHISFINDVTN